MAEHADTTDMWRRGVYPHGLVCGLLMSMVGFAMLGWDVPIPLFAAAFCTPYCAVPGYRYARRHGAAWFGVQVAAMTAATGHVIVFLVAISYAATVQPWPKPLVWLVGLVFVPITVILGIFFGRLGAACVRRPTRSIAAE